MDLLKRDLKNLFKHYFSFYVDGQLPTCSFILFEYIKLGWISAADIIWLLVVHIMYRILFQVEKIPNVIYAKNIVLYERLFEK